MCAFVCSCFSLVSCKECLFSAFLGPEVVAVDTVNLTTGGGCSASASAQVEPKRGVAIQLHGFSGAAPIKR